MSSAIAETGIKRAQKLFAELYDVARYTPNQLRYVGGQPISSDPDISDGSPSGVISSLRAPRLSYRSSDYVSHKSSCGLCVSDYSDAGVQGGDNYFCTNTQKFIEAKVQSYAAFSVPADATESLFTDLNIANISLAAKAYNGSGFLGSCSSSYHDGVIVLDATNGWCRAVGTVVQADACGALSGSDLLNNAVRAPFPLCGSENFTVIKAVFDSTSGAFKGYNTVVCDGSPSGGAMFASTTMYIDPAGIAGVPYPPLVRQVVFDGVTKEPSEGRPGFTLVSVDGAVTQGDLRVLSPAPVTAIFYAYNPNGEQMPLREVLVDWDGNVIPGIGYTSGSLGKYKNRKHTCAAPKECKDGTSPGKACKANADCPGTGATCVDNAVYSFGDTPQACIQDSPNSEGYFSFTKVFMCSGSEPSCTTADQADGCYKADALGPGEGACIFTPKVYVRDNWEWCMGSDGKGKWGTALSPGCNKEWDGAWLPSNPNPISPRTPTSPVRIFVKPKS